MTSPVHSTGLGFMTARPGDPVSADIWNRMNAAVRARQILRGVGTRLTMLPHGTIVSAESPRGFSHPWYVIASAQEAVIRPGLINGAEATIAERKLSEADAPRLRLEDGKYDDTGHGWIALEVKMKTSQGGPGTGPNVLSAFEYIKVVQCANIQNDGAVAIEFPQFFQGIVGLPGFRARYPLARLVLRNGGLDVFQVAYFNLNHKAKVVTRGKIVRHFFWPA